MPAFTELLERAAPPASGQSDPRHLRALQAAAAALALTLALLGVTQELPFSYYGDECHFVKRVLAFGSGDLNPHWFHKPAFYMYLLFGEYGLYYLLGRALGWWPGIQEFAVSYVLDPGPFYLLGRLTGVAFALLTAAVVWRIGERYLGRHSGLLAAVLLATSYGMITAAQRVKADVPATFFGTLSLYGILRYARGRSWRFLVLASAAAGAGAATKVYPIINLVLLFGVIALEPLAARRLDRKSLAAAAGRIGAAFALFWTVHFACAPYSFLDPAGREATFGRFLKLYHKAVSILAGRPVGTIESDTIVDHTVRFHESLADYASVLLSWNGMGPLAGTLGLLGLLWLLARGGRAGRVLAAYTVLFVGVSAFTFPGYSGARHMTPIMPPLALAGGGLLVAAGSCLQGRWKLAASVVLSLALGVQVLQAAARSWARLGEDTRTAAKAWVEENIPAGSRILADDNGPPLLRSRKRLEELARVAARYGNEGPFVTAMSAAIRYQMLAAERAPAYDLHEIRQAWWRREERGGPRYLESPTDVDMGNPLFPVGAGRYEDYVRQGFEYAVVHSAKYERFLRDGEEARARPDHARFYRELFARGELVKELTPGAGRVGPVVKVFRIGRD